MKLHLLVHVYGGGIGDIFLYSDLIPIHLGDSPEADLRDIRELRLLIMTLKSLYRGPRLSLKMELDADLEERLSAAFQKIVKQSILGSSILVMGIIPDPA